jgi:hypothetical protein
MRNRYRRALPAWTSAGWFCLLVGCTPATVDESAGKAAPVEQAASGSAPDTEAADTKHEDVIDRMFSPLDNAVSDINRDLNKGEADAPAGPNE